jgi:hypothetical protein
VRELAFLLGADPSRGKIEPAGQHVEHQDPEVPVVDAEHVNGLMADYLAECENLFALLTKMARGGQSGGRDFGAALRVMDAMRSS